MTIQLLDEAQAHAEFDRRVESREWWVIPVVGGAATDVMCAIEAAHYTGDANADFHLLAGPLPPFGQMFTAFAHKRRMTPDQLAALLAGFDGRDVRDELRAGQDVLVIADDDR